MMWRGLALIGVAAVAAVGLRQWSDAALECPETGRVLSEEELFLAALEVPAAQLRTLARGLEGREALDGYVMPESVTPGEILLVEPDCCALTPRVAPEVREQAEQFRARHELDALRGFVVMTLSDPQLLGEVYREISAVVGVDVCGRILQPTL